MALALKAEVQTYTHDEYLALEEHAESKNQTLVIESIDFARPIYRVYARVSAFTDGAV